MKSQSHRLEKKRMTVHYSSWFIAGAWKDSRKKKKKTMRENNYTCL